MTVTVTRLHETFAAQVSGIDLAHPEDRALGQLAAAIDEYGVVIVRDQTLTNEDQIALASRFGLLEPSVTRYRADNRQRIERKEIVDVSNLDENDRPRAVDDRLRMLLLGNRLWHTDSSFRATPGALSMLYARVVPPAGGETEFADNRAAYETLPSPLKQRVDDMLAEHALMYSREQLGFTDFSQEERNALPPVRHPLVRSSPAHGRRALYMGSHASHIVGLPVPEGRMILRDLLEHATQRERVYAHAWHVGDLVIWDNRCTMHRGKPYDESYPRDLRRVTTSDTEPLSTYDMLQRRSEASREAPARA
ncbi:TauD/TfdA family dioxygenase [Caballeronia sp. LZ065]|uniref:TauD/TfdA dioxygenase family protein n=1 Tax=Caballeronia sp. LZ065 TaxID=3038571 RepID=UPI00285E75D8|nr:TauD/TfdA family dioxygenase [Caballeronia sp. LZ065]MDR5784666.1 TauD/TfdA family dioxygenase [Caballeronia sp. LZ065]